MARLSELLPPISVFTASVNRTEDHYWDNMFCFKSPKLQDFQLFKVQPKDNIKRNFQSLIPAFHY